MAHEGCNFEVAILSTAGIAKSCDTIHSFLYAVAYKRPQAGANFQRATASTPFMLHVHSCIIVGKIVNAEVVRGKLALVVRHSC